MNDNIARLHRVAAKNTRTIVGLMSGTSLDGLDVALCHFTGSGPETKVKLKNFATIPYSTEEKSRIREVFAKPTIDFKVLCELNPWIAHRHAAMVKECLKKWRVSVSRVDVLASHGQTVFHAPMSVTPGVRQNSTLQIGDGDHLAVASGIVTISDFRQKHIAAGGEGAPLAVYGDYLLFSEKGAERVMLNIGGIGNFTYLPASLDREKVFVTDTGPGNTMIDEVVRISHPGQSFDRDATFASKGRVNEDLLRKLKSSDFFQMPFPKTTGPEQFNLNYLQQAQRASATSAISFEDLVATLTRFSAETISEAILKAVEGKVGVQLLLSGGGAHNPLMVKWIAELCPDTSIDTVEKLGIPGDAKEAVLFAVLANEAVAGGKVNYGRRSKVPSVSMGKVSFPK